MTTWSRIHRIHLHRGRSLGQYVACTIYTIAEDIIGWVHIQCSRAACRWPLVLPTPLYTTPLLLSASLHENRENFPCVSPVPNKIFFSFFAPVVPAQMVKVLFAEKTMKHLHILLFVHTYKICYFARLCKLGVQKSRLIYVVGYCSRGCVDLFALWWKMVTMPCFDDTHSFTSYVLVTCRNSTHIRKACIICIYVNKLRNVSNHWHNIL